MTAAAPLACAAALLDDLDGTLVDLVVDRPRGSSPRRSAGIAAGRAAGATVVALRTTHGEDELGDADAPLDNLAWLFMARDGAPTPAS